MKVCIIGAASLLLATASAAQPAPGEWWGHATATSTYLIDAKAIDRPSTGKVVGVVYQVNDPQDGEQIIFRRQFEQDCEKRQERMLRLELFLDQKPIDGMEFSREWRPWNSEETLNGVVSRFFCTPAAEREKTAIRIPDGARLLKPIEFLLTPPPN